MSEHQIYNIAVDTEQDFTYFANNKHNNNYVRHVKNIIATLRISTNSSRRR